MMSIAPFGERSNFRTSNVLTLSEQAGNHLVDGAAVGTASEAGHGSGHDFAHVLGAARAQLAYDGANFGFDLGFGELLRQVALEDGGFGEFFVGEILAVSAGVLVSRFTPLLDLFAQNVLHACIVKLAHALDFGVLDGGAGHAD